MASVQYVHTQRFQAEVVAFIQHFTQLQDVLGRQRAAVEGQTVGSQVVFSIWLIHRTLKKLFSFIGNRFFNRIFFDYGSPLPAPHFLSCLLPSWSIPFLSTDKKTNRHLKNNSMGCVCTCACLLAYAGTYRHQRLTSGILYNRFWPLHVCCGMHAPTQHIGACAHTYTHK